MTAISLGKIIYKTLCNSSVTGYTGTRIYPLVSEDSTVRPFVVYKRNNLTPDYSKDGNTKDISSYTIAVVSNDYSESISIAEIVRNKLENISDTIDNVTIDYIRVKNISESYEFDDSQIVYIQELFIEIKTK